MIFKYNRFLTGIILILGGLLIISLSATAILRTLIIIASLIILFSNIPSLIENSKAAKWKTYNFFDSLMMVIFAIVLLIFPPDFITKIIGGVIFGLSIINLIKAKDKIKQLQNDLYHYILALILIIVDPIDITKIVCWIIGLLVIVTGIILLLDIRLPKRSQPTKSEEPRRRTNVIDVDDFHVHDEE